jgi:hypothetical protein
MRLNLSKLTENLANIAIIAVAILLGFVLVRTYIWPRQVQNPTPTAAQAQRDPRVPAGTKISLPNTDWSKSSRTLVLVVSDTCHFCTDSAEFYKALAAQAQKNSVNIIAVLPQPQEQGKAYLDKLGVSVAEIKQAQLNSIGVNATPTLIMVDQSGSVIESWVGKLPVEKEKEVLSRF